MKKMAFMSRHPASAKQHQLAAEAGYQLVDVGDADGFRVAQDGVLERIADEFDAVAVVHAAAALRFIAAMPVAIFENANRAPVGETPQFEAVNLFIYNLNYAGGVDEVWGPSR